MTTYPLHLLSNHLYLEHDGLWLIGTGSPSSFGAIRNLSLNGRSCILPSSYFGLTAAVLSEHVGVQCQGILGANILNHFDVLFDLPSGRITLTQEEIQHAGVEIPLSFISGVPVVTASIDGQVSKLFFETGAQLSYYQAPSPDNFPTAGAFRDFFPGHGAFETDTRTISISLGAVSFLIRCGCLPRPLATALLRANTEGILGHSILHQRTVAYLPRRARLTI